MNQNILPIVLIIFSIFFFIGCQNNDKNPLIPNNDARAYANEHFTEQLYRDQEWFLATSSEYGNSGSYQGTRESWEAEINWQEKLEFLPGGGFTHELPSELKRSANKSDDQQYYEMISKYIGQFGFGWDAHPDDFPFDNEDTPYFDGQRIYSEIYMSMW